MNWKFTTFAALMFVSSYAAAADKGTKHDIELVREIASIRIDVDRAMAPIKSQSELAAHLRNSANSPLFALDKPLREAFLKSLVFTQHGLASYSWKELSTTNVKDAYKILSLFGEQGAIDSIPGLKARNTNEENILLISPAPTPSIRVDTVKNAACIVMNGGSSCVYEYGSNCNPKCDA